MSRISVNNNCNITPHQEFAHVVSNSVTGQRRNHTHQRESEEERTKTHRRRIHRTTQQIGFIVDY